MTKDINSCTFFGKLANNAAELPSGASRPVAFSVRCTHEFRIGRDIRNQTDVIPCFWWGAEAKKEMHTLLKGRRVFVEGRLETQPGWQGIRVSNVAVVAATGEDEQGAEDDDYLVR